MTTGTPTPARTRQAHEDAAELHNRHARHEAHRDERETRGQPTDGEDEGPGPGP